MRLIFMTNASDAKFAYYMITFMICNPYNICIGLGSWDTKNCGFHLINFF